MHEFRFISNVNMASDPSKPRSLNCSVRSFVRFSNCSPGCAHIIWLNYNGQKRLYRALMPGHFLDLNTFVTHPWIFENSRTGDWLAGNKEKVFFPESWENEYKKLNSVDQQGRIIVPRKVVHITYPVYSLKERSFQVIRDSLSSSELVHKLELPSTLKGELQTFVERKKCLENHSIPCSQCATIPDHIVELQQ